MSTPSVQLLLIATATLSDVYTESIRALSVDFMSTLYINTFTNMFFTPSTRNAVKSSMIKNLEVSAATNQAVVTYNNGSQYVYCGVCDNAIFDILFGNVESFGKWVNKHCKQDADSTFKVAAA